MKKQAEDMVREILHAYNKRPEPNDLSGCYAVAEKHLLKLKAKQPAPVLLQPGTYWVKS